MRRGAGPPGPSDDQGRIRTLAAYESDRLGFLHAAKARYGPIASFDRRTTMLLGSGPAREVLLDRDRAYAVPQNFLQRSVGARYREETWHTRTVSNAAFRQLPVTAVARLAAEAVDQQLQWTSPEPIDPLTLLEHAVSRSVSHYLFGPDGDVLVTPTGELLAALATVIGNPFGVAGQTVTPTRRRIRDRHRRLSVLVDELVQNRVRDPGRQRDLVSLVVSQAAGGLSVARIDHWAMASLLAGYRVPAGAGAWALFCLSQRPDLQDLLASEARSDPQVGTSRAGRQPRHVGLATAVVLESLRLYPPTWITERVASRAVQVEGFTFPAGHRFLISPYVLQRDEAEWPQAQAFSPERWRGSERPTGTYVPFGLGRSNCPGRELATELLSAIVGTVASRWVITDRSLAPVVPNPRTTLLPSGLMLSLTRRTATPSEGGPPLPGGSAALAGRGGPLGRTTESLPHGLS